MIAVGSQIARFQLSQTQWTPVVAPLACSYYMIIGNSDGSQMARGSDTEDPNTWYMMPAGGAWFAFDVPALYKRYRFNKGDSVTFLKATVPGTVAIVEFFN